MPRSVVLYAMLTGLAVPLTTTAGEFGAFSGLWKTVAVLSGAAGAREEPEVKWHCVDEVDDPWVAYAQIVLPPGDICTQTRSERTATTLAWTVECKGPVAIVNSGQVVFDSPSHYTGTVELTGEFMGYPVKSQITLDGQRYAACTSRRD